MSSTRMKRKLGLSAAYVDKAKDAAQQYGVRAMPTFLFFHKGTKVAEMKGADSGKLTQIVEELVKKYNGTI